MARPCAGYACAVCPSAHRMPALVSRGAAQSADRGRGLRPAGGYHGRTGMPRGAHRWRDRFASASARHGGARGGTQTPDRGPGPAPAHGECGPALRGRALLDCAGDCADQRDFHRAAAVAVRVRGAQCQPMKTVMFVLPSLGGGGAERVVLTLLKHLDRTQFSLSLVVINTRRSVHLGEVPRDVELIDFGSRRVRAALVKLMRLIRGRRPDVVFSTQGYLNLGIALLKPWLPAGTRCVARETSIVSKVLHLHRRPAILQFLYRRIYQRLDTVVCQSRAMRDDLVTAYGFPADKTVIIHNPVDVDWVRARAREKVELVGLKPGCFNLVTAGRLSPEKGLDIVIAAVALCRMPDLNLVILGEGKLRATLEALASKLRVRGQVQFAGFRTNPYP